MDRRCAFTENADLTKEIRDISQFLTRDGQKFGLHFCGTYGNGKTTMLRALQSAIRFIIDKGLATTNLCGLRVVDAVQLSRNASEQTFQTICQHPLLAVDDIGREPREVMFYGNVYNPICELLEYRYAHQLFTITSTNLTSEELKAKYGQRITDRLNEMMHCVIFVGQSFR